ncbi:extracellular serine-rich [Fusarium sporotrichioides]|uniref:Extracellular serine-rich n=1 Tax=Fusarium sporotrichioides TaxID=5514 RepID=A0A395SN17_FUSSP|nr:extracellular serine-rich [Fusarium sporotrichioides]
MMIKSFLWAVAVSAMPLVEMSPRQLHTMEQNKPLTIRKNPPLAPRANRIIPVVVGGPQDTFVPNMIRAAVGDVIQFQFSNGNHTVTQSSEDSPCQPLQATQSGVIHSGHVPFVDGQTTVGTFNVPLTSTDPIYLYCATGPHCQLGQVMAINPPSEANLVEFNKKANGALANVDAGDPTGGTVGEIPLAEAAFIPAPPEDGAPPAPPAESPPAPPADTPAAAPTPPVVESPPAAPPVAEAPAEMAPAPPAEVPGATPEAVSMGDHY